MTSALVKFTSEQRRLMLHAIGGQNGEPVYRNYFVAHKGTPAQTLWDDLVTKGLATGRDDPPNKPVDPDADPIPSKSRCYSLTEAGLFHPDLHAGQKPAIVASMYFDYGKGQKRAGVKASSTFDAIMLGERISTTRFKNWIGTEKWRKAEAGTLIRFHSDMRCQSAEYLDAVVTSSKAIHLGWCSKEEREEWSRCEGWTPDFGQATAMKSGEGIWVRFNLLSMSPAAEQRLAAARNLIAASERSSPAIDGEHEPVTETAVKELAP